MRKPRLLIVSNRLPVTVVSEGGETSLVRSSGGLATGLWSAHDSGDGWWVGWSGKPGEGDKAEREGLNRLLASMRLAHVPLSARETRAYYETFSNGVLWPLFHCLPDKIPLDSQGWDTYWRINERFADAVAARYSEGDIIWVHDYHLLVLPGMLRQRLPGARIGFFLHIPFPPADLFRVLPWRRPIVEGLLGADHIGFHTRGYARHFLTALQDVLGLETYGGRLTLGPRTITTGAHPMGIDAPGFDRLGRSSDVAALRAAFRNDGDGRRVLLGLDRLDYTKGIPRRLLAFERLLEESPELRGSVRLVQVAVPSRGQVESYRAFRREIEEIVGRINGRFGTVSSVPIHYLHRSFSPEEVVAMYQAADVMVVTPLRDGMNLVAKEFVASRTDEEGVLVLSEFAGAAAQLPEALAVNPFDIPGTAAALARALAMPEDERRQRMRRLRQHVFDYDVHRWVREFLANVEGPPVTGRWLESRWPERPAVSARYFSTRPARASTSR